MDTVPLILLLLLAVSTLYANASLTYFHRFNVKGTRLDLGTARGRFIFRLLLFPTYHIWRWIVRHRLRHSGRYTMDENVHLLRCEEAMAEGIIPTFVVTDEN